MKSKEINSPKKSLIASKSPASKSKPNRLDKRPRLSNKATLGPIGENLSIVQDDSATEASEKPKKKVVRARLSSGCDFKGRDDSSPQKLSVDVSSQDTTSPVTAEPQLASQQYVDNSEQAGRLLEEFRPFLRRIVGQRLDLRLRGRVDASDVVQEAYLEATRRLDYYLDRKEVPFYTWVRFLTTQKIDEFHRRHLSRQKRDVRREVSLSSLRNQSQHSTTSLDQLISSKAPSPAELFWQGERKLELARALESLKREDREVIHLRHEKAVGNSEVAKILGLTDSAASLRYVRALKRLAKQLD